MKRMPTRLKKKDQADEQNQQKVCIRVKHGFLLVFEMGIQACKEGTKHEKDELAILHSGQKIVNNQGIDD